MAARVGLDCLAAPPADAVLPTPDQPADLVDFGAVMAGCGCGSYCRIRKAINRTAASM